MLADIRLGFRVLVKSPGATAIAVLALALGIGANAMMFVSLRALVLRPLPYPRLDEIVTVWGTAGKTSSQRDAVSPADFLDWREQAHSFRELAAYRGWEVNLTGVADPERLQGCTVSPGFFHVLGMRPQLGRTFSKSEAEPGNDAVAVLSYGFWKSHFAGASDVASRRIFLDGRSFTVIGVMPEDFDFPLATDVWAPLAFTPGERADRAGRTLQVIGRLAPGVSLAQARAEMTGLAARLDRQYPDTNSGRSAALFGMLELTNQGTDRFVTVLMAAASFVLLLACANVANMHLARSAGRMKETAIRAALGGTRRRIARQLLVESLLVSLAGGAMAMILCVWTDAWRTQVPQEVYRWVAGMRTLRFDGGALLYIAAVAILTGLLCGVGSALHASSPVGMNERLKQGGRSSVTGRHGLRRFLVGAEVALAMVLLTGAGLMVQTFRRMAQTDLGYDPSHLLTMRVALQSTARPGPSEWRSFYEGLRARLEAQPGVVAAAIEGDSTGTTEFTIEGRPQTERSASVPWVRTVSPGYFRAMGIPVRQGRAIDLRDGPDAPGVILLSESVARRYWNRPGEAALGGRVRIGGPQAAPLTVIGITGDVRHWFMNDPQPLAYVSFRQQPNRSAQVLTRTHGDPIAAAGMARAEVRALDPNQPVYDLRSMEQQLADQMSGVRTAAVYMTAFAAFALILAATGTYGVVSYMVSQRTQEMGVRMALGAYPSQVLRMVIGQSLRLCAAGLAVGLAAAYWLMRAMSSAVYGVVVLDWTVFAGFALLLAAAAALAGYIPARRAAATDLISALRFE
jgi:putative ABC transport system permease protein